jgi:hypothetical protein
MRRWTASSIEIAGRRDPSGSRSTSPPPNVDFQYTRLTRLSRSTGPAGVPGGAAKMTTRHEGAVQPGDHVERGRPVRVPDEGGRLVDAASPTRHSRTRFTRRRSTTAQAQPLNDRKTAWIDSYELTHARASWQSPSHESGRWRSTSTTSATRSTTRTSWRRLYDDRLPDGPDLERRGCGTMSFSKDFGL